MEDFKTWLRIYDYENDCAIPEEFIPALHDAFVAGGGEKPKKKKNSQKSLFDGFEDDLSIADIYTDMPEYVNEKQQPPIITATFKFQTLEDYDDFKTKISKYLYNGEKVFDGKQKLTEKQSWYPHKPKASQYCYVDKEKGDK